MSNPSIADDVVERGMIVFENQIKDKVTGLDADAFLAIDVDPGDFEVSDDDIHVFDILKARRPNAVIFLRRVGNDAAYFMGGGYTWRMFSDINLTPV